MLFSIKFVQNFVLITTCIFSMSSFVSFSAAQAQEQLWQGYGGSQAAQTATGIPGSSGVSIVIDPNTPRFFLLKSGLLMQASGVKDETHYEVKTEFGTMQIPIENVEFVSESREQIWQYKKSLVDPASCTQFMKLAEWCFHNNFQEEGIEQYRQALKVVPNDQLGDFIRQRLAALESKNGSDKENVADNNRPESGIHVVAEAPENDPEWDRWTNGVPSSVFNTFSKKVQPILVQRCASAACHGSNSDNQYKINIPRQSGGRTTTGNLRSSVAWIDTENPSNSPLLSALITSHAGKKALFSVESEQYHCFIEWIQLAGKELPGDLNPQLAARLKDQQKIIPPQPITAPIKTDVLPKQFQESLAAQQTKAIDRAFAPLISGDADSVSPSSVQNKIPDSNTNSTTNILNPAEYSPTRFVVPNAPIAKEVSVQKAETVDPFDPNRFNAKYHTDLLKFKTEKK